MSVAVTAPAPSSRALARRRALSQWAQPPLGENGGARVVRPGDAVRREDLPRGALTASFSRASGAGGQNVNKVSTKAEVRFSLDGAGWLDEAVRARFRELHAGAVTAAGDVVVASQRHRTQEANLADALDKLARLVTAAAAVPKVRMLRTGLSELTKNERVQEKRHRAEVKSRRRVSWSGADE